MPISRGSTMPSRIAAQIESRASSGMDLPGNRPNGCRPTPTTYASVMRGLIDDELPAGKTGVPGSEMPAHHGRRGTRPGGELPRLIRFDDGEDDRPGIQPDPGLNVRHLESAGAPLGDDAV